MLIRIDKYIQYFCFVCLISIIQINCVAATNVQEIYYVNKNGVELTKIEYDELIERFDEGFVKTASSELIEEALIEKDMILVPKDEITTTARSNFYYSCSDYADSINLGDIQACVNVTVTPSLKTYNFELFVEWNSSKIPQITKSYDILAMRWTSNFNGESYTGNQRNENKVVNYSNKGTNSKWGTTGAGISMNIIDDTNSMLTFTTNLKGYFSEKKSTTINMTYLHTQTAVTLTQSQNYSFSSSGLGKVIKFNSSTINNYYSEVIPMSITLTPSYIK